MGGTILPIGIRLLTDEAKKPVYSTKGAAGCDIYATEDFIIEPAKIVYLGETEVWGRPDYVIDNQVRLLQERDKRIVQIKQECKEALKALSKKKDKRQVKEYYKGQIALIETSYLFNVQKENIDLLLSRMTVKQGVYTTKVGIAFDIPEGSNIELEIRGRSGLAFKSEIIAFNGTLDEDYKGELAIKLWNLGTETMYFKKGDRIAQGVFKKVIQADFVDPAKLPINEEDNETKEQRKHLEHLRAVERGERWAGSTGLGEGREVEVQKTAEEYFVTPPVEEKLYSFGEEEVDKDSELIEVEAEKPVSGVEVVEISEEELPFKESETVTERQLEEENRVKQSVEEFIAEGNEQAEEDIIEVKEGIGELLVNEGLQDLFFFLDLKDKKNVHIHFADSVLLKNKLTNEVSEHLIIDTNYYRNDASLLEVKLRVGKYEVDNFELLAFFNSKTVIEKGGYENLITESTNIPVAVRHVGDKENDKRSVYMLQPVGVSRTLDHESILTATLEVECKGEELLNVETLEISLKCTENPVDTVYLKGYVREVELGDTQYKILMYIDLKDFAGLNQKHIGQKLDIKALELKTEGIETIYFNETVVNNRHTYNLVEGAVKELTISTLGLKDKVTYSSEPIKLYVPTK